MTSPQNTVINILKWLAHSYAAFYICPHAAKEAMILWQRIFQAANGGARPSDLLLANHFYPLQILSGFLSGFLISWMADRKMARFAFVLPLSYFLYRFFSLQPESVMFANSFSRGWYFFGTGCELPYCLGQFAVTMPLYCSVAYSVAALLQPKITVLMARRD